MKPTEAERMMLEVLGQTIIAMDHRCTEERSGVLQVLSRVAIALERGDLARAAEAIEDERERQTYRAERAARREGAK